MTPRSQLFLRKYAENRELSRCFAQLKIYFNKLLRPIIGGLLIYSLFQALREFHARSLSPPGEHVFIRTLIRKIGMKPRHL